MFTNINIPENSLKSQWGFRPLSFNLQITRPLGLYQQRSANVYIQTIDYEFIALPHLNREDSRKSHNVHAQKRRNIRNIPFQRKALLNEQTGGLKFNADTLAYYATKLPQNRDNHTVRITNTPRRQKNHQPHKTRLFPSQTSNQKSLAPAQRRTKKNLYL